MNAQTKAKIERTRDELYHAEMHPDTKENLHAMLDSAELAANGISDVERVKAMCDAILNLSLIEVQKVIRIDDTMKQYAADAVNSHVMGCPFGGNKKFWHVFLTRVLPWVLCVLLGLAPQAGKIKEAVGLTDVTTEAINMVLPDGLN